MISRKYCLFIIICFYLLSSCNSKSEKLDNQRKDSFNLPFIGEKWFEFYPLFSGTGTEQHYVKIAQNGDVYFCFIQVNQITKEETNEEIYAGKYKDIITFQNKNYIIHKEVMIIVDEKGEVLYDRHCCQESSSYDNEKNEPCISVLHSRE